MRPARAFLAVVLLVACAAVSPALSFRDAGEPAVLAARIADAMSADELLGQVFFLGWQGQGLSADILRWIGTRGIGGVKIFPRNVSDLSSLAREVATMQRLAARGKFAIPLFVATDQEGGWVRQIKEETSVSPGNLALGAAGVPGDAYRTGYLLGKELAAVGINMDFAPAADVYSNPEASVIGPRSFGSDPSSTGLLSAAFARGLKDAGVLSTAKHFPGHGAADKDSHGHLPKIDATMDQLLDRDLIPFRILIREGIPAIMTAHLAFPRILGSLTPSSLSPFFVQSVLRDRLGFKGIVITDDMEMEGVLAAGLDTAGASRRALEAGNDMILVSHTPDAQEKTWNALSDGMRTNAAFRAAVKESVRRILETKLRAFRPDPAVVIPLPELVPSRVPAPGAREFFSQVSARAVTLLSGKRIPYAPARHEKILIAGQYREFLAEGRRRFPWADTYFFPFVPFYSARPEDTSAISAMAGSYDTIILCVANYNSLEVLQELSGMPGRVIVISALSPVYLDEAPWVQTALAVYGDGVDSFRAGFSVLAGDYPASGVLPLRFAAQARP